jgi:hypothetical protein
MAEQPQAELSPVGASFAEHLGAFHRSLPPEEQKLLEEILALADRGMAADDTSGYAVDAFIYFAAGEKQSAAGVPAGPTGFPSFSFGRLLQ